MNITFIYINYKYIFFNGFISKSKNFQHPKNERNINAFKYSINTKTQPPKLKTTKSGQTQHQKKNIYPTYFSRNIKRPITTISTYTNNWLGLYKIRPHSPQHATLVIRKPYFTTMLRARHYIILYIVHYVLVRQPYSARKTQFRDSDLTNVSNRTSLRVLKPVN